MRLRKFAWCVEKHLLALTRRNIVLHGAGDVLNIGDGSESAASLFLWSFTTFDV